MKWKTLLVHLDDSAHCANRLHLVLDVASRFDAHVIGLYAVRQDLLHRLMPPSDDGARRRFESHRQEARETAQAAFESAARLAGVVSEWRAPGGDATEALVQHGRHADVLVLGHDNSDEQSEHVSRRMIEDVVIGVGRPVLVMPRAGIVKILGDNVVLAWDDSREAARAVADALPILRSARFVEVMTIERHRDEDTPAGIDISAYLDRQGVRASFSSTPRLSGLNTGMTLINRASSVHANLIVAGAYAHARGLERVLGGVTRSLLEGSILPVLFSH
ncbi:universal stress protein [Caballeronia sp. BR00000012568055]|uniref:universal stress protein n=1 Tax=Caballeronia sp. BR00000012568055 TaxID=2918761 RepID=UPI0023F89A0E|nr:universal stress protein [Caballeronia sp. BR00000012568055]